MGNVLPNLEGDYFLGGLLGLERYMYFNCTNSIDYSKLFQKPIIYHNQ